MKIAFFLLILSTNLISCQKNKTSDLINNYNMDMTSDTIENILKKQIEAGAAEEYGSFDDYKKEDLDILIKVENVMLKQNGFKTISNTEFSEKIYLIFKRKIDYSMPTEYLRINSSDKCDNKLEYNPFTSDYQDIYISKKNNFITYFKPLPEIIDYLKIYPNLSSLDNNKLEVTVDNEKIQVLKWKDIPNLAETRNYNGQLLINRNKYLFNNDKSCFGWLTKNDTYFMESLVTTFGYTQNEEILDWVMKKNISKATDFIKDNLFVKNCKGELEVREGILKYIEQHTNNEEHRYFDALTLLYFSPSNKYFWAELDEQEIYRSIAYIANTNDYLFMKYNQLGYESNGRWSFLGAIFYNDDKGSGERWQKIEKYFKTNNYYGLPHLKEVLNFAYNFDDGPYF